MTQDEIKKGLEYAAKVTGNGVFAGAYKIITDQEIERLRTTLGQCNTELNSALESLKSQCREIGALKAGTKQAKIDVLNRLKQIYGYYSCYSLGNDVRSLNVIIDEIIKEVQNE